MSFQSKSALCLCSITVAASLLTSCQKKQSDDTATEPTKDTAARKQLSVVTAPLISPQAPAVMPVQTTITSIKKAGSKALLSVDIKNQHAQAIRSYKGMILLLDHKGELVGVKNRWLIGGSTTPQNGSTLDSEKTESVNLVIDHDRPFTDDVLIGS